MSTCCSTVSKEMPQNFSISSHTLCNIHHSQSPQCNHAVGDSTALSVSTRALYFRISVCSIVISEEMLDQNLSERLIVKYPFVENFSYSSVVIFFSRRNISCK